MSTSIENTSTLPERLWVKLKDGIFRNICTSEIEWIEAASNYVRICSAGDILVSRTTIRSLENHFGTTFLRLHRSFLVNRELLKELRNENGKLKAVLSTGAEFPVSRHYRSSLLASMGGPKLAAPGASVKTGKRA